MKNLCTPMFFYTPMFCDLKCKDSLKIHYTTFVLMNNGSLHLNLFFIRLIRIREITQIIFNMPNIFSMYLHSFKNTCG